MDSGRLLFRSAPAGAGRGRQGGGGVEAAAQEEHGGLHFVRSPDTISLSRLAPWRSDVAAALICSHAALCSCVDALTSSAAAAWLSALRAALRGPPPPPPPPRRRRRGGLPPLGGAAGEPAPRGARARGLDGGVQREEVRLL